MRAAEMEDASARGSTTRTSSLWSGKILTAIAKAAHSDEEGHAEVIEVTRAWDHVFFVLCIRHSGWR